ncbi:hypothetical protein [uncultured Marivita sp.]|jgi:hypothetical protein|uniref:hypothetical protein n=1 Tax=Marivita sp. TaxID=2003365 RepID=UPI0025E23F44|nr:hypothetical protein [uncultured Marivita sp.]MCR9108057.1 hypothetical protein [Paracoccaceae bacterium]
MQYAPKKTAAMITVLALGLGIVWAGFATKFLSFGVSIVLCFLVWIIGARIVHMALSRF